MTCDERVPGRTDRLNDERATDLDYRLFDRFVGNVLDLGRDLLLSRMCRSATVDTDPVPLFEGHPSLYQSGATDYIHEFRCRGEMQSDS
jgi:hypothetical protein